MHIPNNLPVIMIFRENRYFFLAKYKFQKMTFKIFDKNSYSRPFQPLKTVWKFICTVVVGG